MVLERDEGKGALNQVGSEVVDVLGKRAVGPERHVEREFCLEWCRQR